VSLEVAGSTLNQGIRPWLVAGASYAVAAVFATWPVAAHLSTHLPLGSLENATVPIFNIWTFEWNAQALARGYRGYWDAPIFYPTQGTFALSEAQALTGLVFAALTRAVSSVTAYNLLLLAALVLNGLAARRLLRVLGASNGVATAAGMLALGASFVWKELGVIQLTMLWPVWLAFGELALLAGARAVLAPAAQSARFGTGSGSLERVAGSAGEIGTPSSTVGSANALVRLALWCAAMLWTCTYYALFIAVFLLLAIAMFVRRDFFLPPARRAGGLAAVLLLASAYPLLAQQRVVATYTRSTKTIHDGGATARAYTRYPAGAIGGRVLPLLAAPLNKRALNPGIVLLLFAAVGISSQVERRRRAASPEQQRDPQVGPLDEPEPEPVKAARPESAAARASNEDAPGDDRVWVPIARVRRFFVWCGVCLVIAIVLSFGARWSIAGFAPYEMIVERYVPGFGNARSPYRFAAFVQVFLIVFAGVGLETLRRSAWRGRAPGRRRDLVLSAAVALAFFEVLPLGARIERFPAEALRAPWIDFLAQHSGGAVAMVPPAPSGKAEAFEPTALAMLQGLRHGHPLLNGYSGFFPVQADAVVEALKKFPDARSKRLLARVPVRYVVVEKAWLGPRRADELAPLTQVFDSDTHAIYRVPEPPAR
jgi:hypothetical protein